MEISISNLPLDPVVMLLVLLAGLFQKKYLETINLNGAWKTLAVSGLFTVVYILLMLLADRYTKDLPLNSFFSFVTTTSLYELFLKKFLSKYFPESAGSKAVIVLLLLLPVLTGCSSEHPGTITPPAELAAQQATLKSLRDLLCSVIITGILTVFTGIVCVHKILVFKKDQDRCPQH